MGRNILIYALGTNSPGTNSLGTKHPGTKHPGTKHPGTKHPGTKHPGMKCPLTKSQGTKSPGTKQKHALHVFANERILKLPTLYGSRRGGGGGGVMEVTVAQRKRAGVINVRPEDPVLASRPGQPLKNLTALARRGLEA
jgi:hypothetical protein